MNLMIKRGHFGMPNRHFLKIPYFSFTQMVLFRIELVTLRGSASFTFGVDVPPVSRGVKSEFWGLNCGRCYFIEKGVYGIFIAIFVISTLHSTAT